MWWIWCVHCEKSRRHFVARTFTLIALVHPVLHRVSCSYEMIPNARKYYEGPMGWIGCVRCEKTRCHFVARTFALIAPVHPVFSPSFMHLRNDPKCTQTLWNAPKHEFRVQWGGSGAFVAKNLEASWHKLLHQFGPFCTEFRNSSKRSQMQQNCTKRTKTSVQGPMGWIGCIGCEKFRPDFVARSFAPVRPILHRVS